jgi:hypothetical protein
MGAARPETVSAAVAYRGVSLLFHSFPTLHLHFTPTVFDESNIL